MIVFAFDRDWTVDVNPHPDQESVPLEWVRHLAHKTRYPVYATGSRLLGEEADIPDVVDIVHRHPDDSERWLGEPTRGKTTEKVPNRSERLSLLADLHPSADRFIVVDDLDLSYVPDWEHYYPEEFVDAVRAGTLPLDPPRVPQQ